MHSKEAIHRHIQDIMQELFDLPPERTGLDAQLADLDIDSIDAVDMMVRLKDFTQKRLSPDDFKHVRTVGDIVDAVHRLLGDDAAA